MAQTVKNRNPFVAAFLSLLLMGLGQLYNGQHRRAIGYFLIGVVAALVAVNANHLLAYKVGVLLHAGAYLLVGVYVVAVIDAIMGARRIGTLTLRFYNRWYVYLGLIVAWSSSVPAIDVAVRPFHIPAGSMMPTLLPGDRIYVDTAAYRWQDPRPGDVIVFQNPKDMMTHYVKRLVGAPGDRVQMRGGVLRINGEPVEMDALEPFPHFDRDGTVTPTRHYRETLPNGETHRILDKADRWPLDDTEEFVVPSGRYFFLGDNRDASVDSRARRELGFVPARNVVGRAEMIYFSSDGTARLWQIFRWPATIRFDRIGKPID